MEHKQSPIQLKVINRAFSDWWDDLVNMIIINLVWLVCWMTILLGPPATIGLYYVTNQLARGESIGLKGLLEGIRRYFLIGWLWLLINLVVAAIIIVNYLFYAAMEQTWANYLQAFFIILGIFWAIIQFYALPYLMEQEKKHIGIAIRNGLFTALAFPGYTLVVAGLAGMVTGISVGLIFPLFLGGPPLIATMGNHAIIERIEALKLREEKLEDEAFEGEES